MNDMTNTWTLWGKFFGFPECCIDTFNREASLMSDFAQKGKAEVRQALIYYRLSRAEALGTRGTGYIPCPECTKKSKEEVIETINSNRRCSKPFPEMNKYEEDLAHLESIIEELV